MSTQRNLATVEGMEISNLFDVSGRTAIVTGGSRGIGYMIAEGLVRNGAKVYITSRKAEELDHAAEQRGERRNLGSSSHRTASKCRTARRSHS